MTTDEKHCESDNHVIILKCCAPIVKVLKSAQDSLDNEQTFAMMGLKYSIVRQGSWRLSFNLISCCDINKLVHLMLF